MNRLSGRVQWGLALLCAGLGATSVSRADALSAVQVLREGGCGGVVPAARPLLRSALLDQVAQEWAAGSSLPAAAQRSAWRAQATTGVRVSGPDSSLLELLRRSDCRALARPGLRQIGVIEIRGVRLAAGGNALIRRQGRIGDDQVNATKLDAKFFRNELHLRRGHALAEFFFSGVGRHAAVRGDSDPGIDFVGRR